MWEDSRKAAICKPPEEGVLPGTSHAGTLIWDFPSPEIVSKYLNHSKAYAFCYSTQNQLKHV